MPKLSFKILSLCALFLLGSNSITYLYTDHMKSRQAIVLYGNSLGNQSEILLHMIDSLPADAIDDIDAIASWQKSIIDDSFYVLECGYWLYNLSNTEFALLTDYRAALNAFEKRGAFKSKEEQCEKNRALIHHLNQREQQQDQ